MMLAGRWRNSASFTGAVLASFRDWGPGVTSSAKSCFEAFDEILLKVRSDSEATRVISLDERGPPAEILTGLEGARRNVPQRWRKEVDLYVAVVVRKLNGGRDLLWNTPPWCAIFIESANGTLSRLHGQDEWNRSPLQADDRCLHVVPFGREFHWGHVAPEGECLTRRISQLVEESLEPRTQLRFEVPL